MANQKAFLHVKNKYNFPLFGGWFPPEKEN